MIIHGLIEYGMRTVINQLRDDIPPPPKTKEVKTMDKNSKPNKPKQTDKAQKKQPMDPKTAQKDHGKK